MPHKAKEQYLQTYMDEMKALTKLHNFIKMRGCASCGLAEGITCRRITGARNLMFILTGLITFMVMIGMFMHKKLMTTFPTCRACLPFSYWAERLPATSTTSLTILTCRPTR